MHHVADGCNQYSITDAYEVRVDCAFEIADQSVRHVQQKPKIK